jgi:hypothetical protein
MKRSLPLICTDDTDKEARSVHRKGREAAKKKGLEMGQTHAKLG